MSIQNGYCFCANEWFLDVSIRNELPLLLLISSLCAKTGYCFAANDYLAEKLGLTPETASRKLAKLQNKGYITVTYQKRGAEVINREIRLTKLVCRMTKISTDDCSTASTDDCSEYQPTIDENIKDNNINIKNTSINKKYDNTNVLSTKKNEEIDICSRWNNIAQQWGLSQIRTLGTARKKNLDALLAELGMGLDEFFSTLAFQIEDSLWLRGKELSPEHELVDREWRCTFDFLVEPRTRGPRRGIPVIEGKYADPDLVRIRQKRAEMEKEVNAKE